MFDKVIVGLFVAIMFIGMGLGVMYFSRFFNAATLHTQVIEPRPGVECVVVSATDSTSVDCWKTL
jgi:hypothetical protein